MTSVDREGIVSKKICGNFKVMTISKKLQAIILARTHHSNTIFTPNTCYLLLASGMESRLQLLRRVAKQELFSSIKPHLAHVIYM